MKNINFLPPHTWDSLGTRFGLLGDAFLDPVRCLSSTLGRPTKFSSSPSLFLRFSLSEEGIKRVDGLADGSWVMGLGLGWFLGPLGHL